MVFWAGEHLRPKVRFMTLLFGYTGKQRQRSGANGYHAAGSALPVAMCKAFTKQEK